MLISRIKKAFRHSLDGLSEALAIEESFKLDFLLSLILIPISFYVAKNAVEAILLIFPLFLIMMCELLNSGIEKIIDETGKVCPLHKFAKDVGSASVFLGFVLLVLNWVLILVF